MYLGNINTKRDWGYSPEYVDLMWKILQHEESDDFVIATGVAHTVREFCEFAFQRIGIDIVWEGKDLNEKGLNRETSEVLVEIDSNLYRPLDVYNLLGDSSKAKKLLGWNPKTNLKSLVDLMVEHEFNFLKDKKTMILEGKEKDNNVLIIGAGGTLSTHKKQIRRFVKEKKCSTIGINNMTSFITPKYHLWTNRERFGSFGKSVKKRIYISFGSKY